MLDGEYLVIVVVDAVVKDGLDNQVLTGLRVEKQGVELLEDMLHRQGHVTVTACQVKVILFIGNQITLDGTADALIQELVLIPFDDDGFHKCFINIQRFD